MFKSKFIRILKKILENKKYKWDYLKKILIYLNLNKSKSSNFNKFKNILFNIILLNDLRREQNESRYFYCS